MTNRPQIHLIGNAHLDPVWLWDRYEGLNEAIATVRAILDLMDRFPEMTFIRGEAAVYAQIARWDPSSLRRIHALVEAGRWDIVGGNWIQPDTNIPGTEALLRQYDLGQAWFREHFGRAPTCAWAADSFGHGAGFPEIYAAAGFDSFVFSRPLPEQLKLESSLFWWEGPAGSRILSYRNECTWYGMERDEIPRRLAAAAETALKSPLRMTAAFYGLGNHGGGPSARHLEDIRAWQQAHPEFEVVHSGLHRLMAAFRAAMELHGWSPPVFRGELNFCLRGCYASSMATKNAYRAAEAASLRAEAAQSAALLSGASPARTRQIDWTTLCFNAFHDILPGSSIEKATTMQLEAMARLSDEARDLEYESLLVVARTLRHPDFAPALPADHPLPQPVLLFNPHPWDFEGVVEVESPLDYRPQVALPGTYETLPVRILDNQGRDLPYQRLEPRNQFLPQFPWRLHAAVKLSIPALGYQVIYPGWWPEAGAPPVVSAPLRASEGTIAGGSWEVSAQSEGQEVRILRDGRSLFGDGGLAVRMVVDSFGSWGGHYDEPGSNDLQETIEYWKIDDVRMVEAGPLRARLWVCFCGSARRSRLELEFILRHGVDHLEIGGRLLWSEPGARLKLELPAGASAEYEVPGGTHLRRSLGEVPGGRHVRVERSDEAGHYAFASDHVSGFNLGYGTMQCTLVRTTAYAQDKSYDRASAPWRPLHDEGLLRFRMALAAGEIPAHRLGAVVSNPIGWMVIPRMDGTREGPLSGMRIEPATVELIGIRPSTTIDGAVELRMLNHGEDCVPEIYHHGSVVRGPSLRRGAIGSRILQRP